MKKRILTALTAAVLSLGAVSCVTDVFGPDTFTVPEIGTRFDNEKSKGSFVLDKDLKENVINLNRYKTISYGSFELYPNKKIDFYAPLNTNAQNQARWFLRMPKDSSNSCSFTAFYSELPIGAKNLEDLERQLREKLSKEKSVTDYKLSYDVRGPNRIIKYTVSAKEEKTGRAIMVNAMMFIDVNHPDHFYSVSTERCGFNRLRKDAPAGSTSPLDTEINDPRMLEAIDYFFDTFRQTNHVTPKQGE